jgi:hypothetical protein
MKKVILFFLFVVFSLPDMTAQNNQVNKNPVGTWKFESPYAPEGFTTGTIEVVYADNKYSATIAFTGNENKFAGDKIKFRNDTLFFNVYIESQNVAVSLAFIDETKMAGKAVYSEGVVPFSLSRDMKKE